MRQIYFISFLFLFLMSISCSQESYITEGWRLPAKEEAVSKWRPEGEAPYLVMNADLNGDGKEDEAKILVRDDNSGVGLFVFLSSNAKPEIILLDTVEDKNALSYMGIFPVKPGEYKTALGKGYGGDWAEYEPERIVIINTGIEFFAAESSSIYFYWDKSFNKFRKTWISD